MSWQMANRIASIAATQAHHELDVDQSSSHIQVSSAIHRAGLTLMWQPLDGLSGAYMSNPGDAAGIIVNENLTRAVRRHTAAHELGHHRLKHPTTLDPGTETADPLGLPPIMHRRQSTERAAEAFATWFLMPRPTVRAALRQLDLEVPHDPAHAYQLSLLLGTSYATTVRHLPSLRLVTEQTATQWTKTPPARFKRSLAGDHLNSTRDVDVWRLGRDIDQTVHTTPGDLIVSCGPILSIDGPIELVGSTGQREPVIACREPADGHPEPATIRTRLAEISVVVVPRPHGYYLGPTQRGPLTGVTE